MESFSAGNRPGQQRTTKVASTDISPAHTARAAATKRRMSWIKIAIVTVLVLAGAGAGWWFMVKNSESALVNKEQYQTVFLSNGQVYFGKLDVINKDYLKLTDIYYLQVQQSVQPTDGKTNTENPTADSQTQLVKLGNELHGPEDAMQINRSQVLFWENIKDDGEVAKAIAKNQNK
jgi:hypothetical protein